MHKGFKGIIERKGTKINSEMSNKSFDFIQNNNKLFKEEDKMELKILPHSQVNNEDESEEEKKE
jgi:hypothetical protein